MKKASLIKTFKYSLSLAAGVALFWTIYYLVQGYVPQVSSLILTEKLIYQLPFSISRWWDIFIGFIWSFTFFYLFYKIKEKEETDKDDYVFNLIFGLTVGLIFGLYLSWSIFESGLGYVLLLGFLSGLVFSLLATSSCGLAYGIGFSLTVGLIFGLLGGLISGLLGGLALLIGHGLKIGYVRTIKFLSIMLTLWSRLIVKN